MTTYNADGIGALIYKNGKWGPGGNKTNIVAFLDTAIAVALAESGGDSNVIHKNSDGSTDYGLWQINSVHKAYLSQGKWDNAADNTEMARKVWTDAGNSFHPWATYTSGVYKAHLGHGAAVYDKLLKLDKNTGPSTLAQMLNFVPGGGAAVGAALDATGAAGAVTNAIESPFEIAKGVLDSVFRFIKESAIVIGVFIIGVVLLLGGFRLLLQNSATYRKVEGQAVGVAKLAALA